MPSDPPAQPEAEIILLRSIAQGDLRAFEELYDLYAGILFAAAYRVLNQQQAAEDVLQESFLLIWEKAPCYDPSRGKPLPWALTLTRHKAIDRLRSVQRRNRLQDEVQQEAEIFTHIDERSSFEAVASEETGGLVRAAMRKLSADQREALELAFFHSLPQSEIAERLQVPLGTVKARIRRGMLKLKDLLGNESR